MRPLRFTAFACLAVISPAVLALGPAESKSAEAGESWTESYTLGTCPISGQKLGSMGDPIVKTYDGREVRFCCGGCIGKFKADLEASWAKVDAAMILDQTRYYPLETCVVSGEPLSEGGEDIATEMIYGNRLIRLCCKMCVSQFKDDPGAFIEKLNEATADAQRAEYPLETCVVGGGKLGSMGEPVEMVVAGRLMRFCCGGCVPKVEADPLKFLAMIDQAWQGKGMYMPMGTGEHAEHGKADKAHGEGAHADHGDHGKADQSDENAEHGKPDKAHDHDDHGDHGG